jgi:deoxyribodipyrimidine photo-lyase
MTATDTIIAWFRQDLRLADNPALAAAAKSGATIVPLYILDDEDAGDWAMGAASRWWLHHSLLSLNKSLDGKLQVRKGAAATVLADIAKATGAKAIYWNRCYEPWRMTRDASIRAAMQAAGLTIRTYNGSQLFEPTAVLKSDGSPYRVFTPYYRNGCLDSGIEVRKPQPKPRSMKLHAPQAAADIASLGLLPRNNWYRQIAAEWSPGENGALHRLREFLDHGIAHYDTGRDRPDKQHVSRLSPHLHFGEISPHQVWHAVAALQGDENLAKNCERFQSELGWREFSVYQLNYWPEMPRDNLQRKFNRFPWRDDAAALQRWQTGRTGYPIVDAGMRELWQTGFMHNRLRMIVASFLVKNLLLHWHSGAEWFWDTLLDADLANNSASWQWVAGCGRDAAPYFRIFNPVTQGKRFDPNGDYVRRYVPEIAALPDKYLQSPWTAPDDVLRDANLRLGEDYPLPVVDLKTSRERALAAFRSLTAED